MGGLANLEALYLSGNQLTGCIPSGLRNVSENDLSSLGLQFCADSAAPDLVVQSPSVSDSSPAVGASFTLRVTVRNQGDGESAATTLRYYRSSDATVSTSDTQVGTDTVGVLAASGTSAESIGLTAPSGAGTYYYGACVEAVTGEADTANNCSPGVQVEVETDQPPSTDYEPLAGLRVSPGRVQYSFINTGGCIRLSASNITTHASKWQRRTDANSPWADVPGTEQSGGLCSLNPTAPGEYRMIADVTIGGARDSYSSENTFTVQ